MTAQPNSPDINHLALYATNEGDLYPQWCAMARRGVNCPDSEWTTVMRAYVLRLLRERRYSGSRSAATINAAAMQVRDYYLRHIAESSQ